MSLFVVHGSFAVACTLDQWHPYLLASDFQMHEVHSRTVDRLLLTFLLVLTIPDGASQVGHVDLLEYILTSLRLQRMILWPMPLKGL